jgi:uncharacterized protein (DUF1499 family)
MKRKLAVVVFAGIVSLVGTAPAFAAEHNPGKFGPHDTQCAAGTNQPNCVGSH